MIPEFAIPGKKSFQQLVRTLIIAAIGLPVRAKGLRRAAAESRIRIIIHVVVVAGEIGIIIFTMQDRIMLIGKIDIIGQPERKLYFGIETSDKIVLLVVHLAVVHHCHRVVIPARSLVLKISAVGVLNR